MNEVKRIHEAMQRFVAERQVNANERAEAERQYNTAPIVRVEVDHVPYSGTRPAYLAVTPYARYLRGGPLPDMVAMGREIQVVNLPSGGRVSARLRRVEDFFKTKLLGKTAAEADRLFPEPIDYGQI